MHIFFFTVPTPLEVTFVTRIHDEMEEMLEKAINVGRSIRLKRADLIDLHYY